MARNGGTKVFLAGSAVVVSILIALAAGHTSRPHKGAVTSESLEQHVSTARQERQEAKQERRDIIAKIDHIEASVHSVETKQAVMSDTLDRIYDEIKNMD